MYLDNGKHTLFHTPLGHDLLCTILTFLSRACRKLPGFEPVKSRVCSVLSTTMLHSLQTYRGINSIGKTKYQTCLRD